MGNDIPAGEARTGALPPLVTSIVLNYNSTTEMMSGCLDSLRQQTYANHRILLVDNHSKDDILPQVAELYPEIEILRLDWNHGFSGGVNRGIERAAGEYVFLLNYDARAEPDCIRELVEVVEADPAIAGVAPKMMLAGHPGVFDSVGIGLADYAGAFNIGIGQPDIGQYDASEEIFGACFGAALIRREALLPEWVGALDEKYFMYFEDVDWCFRANIMGNRFRSAPAARVVHEHSVSLSGGKHEVKYRLIHLNLLRTVVKDYQWRQALRITAGRLRSELRNAITQETVDRRTSLAVAAGFILDLPRLLGSRRRIQSRRLVDDAAFLARSAGEQPCYDPVRYEPLYTIDTLIAAYRRLKDKNGDEGAARILTGLKELQKEMAALEPAAFSERLRELLAGEPESARTFAECVRPPSPA